MVAVAVVNLVALPEGNEQEKCCREEERERGGLRRKREGLEECPARRQALHNENVKQQFVVAPSRKRDAGVIGARAEAAPS